MRLDRIGDDGGRALLALGSGTFAGDQAVFGLLDPAGDGIEGAGGLGAGFAGQALSRWRPGRSPARSRRATAAGCAPCRGSPMRGFRPALREPGETFRQGSDIELLRRGASPPRSSSASSRILWSSHSPKRHAGAARCGFGGIAGPGVNALHAPGQARRHVSARLGAAPCPHGTGPRGRDHPYESREAAANLPPTSEPMPHFWQLR